MKYLFTANGFYFDQTVTFTVSKISDNLYLADCPDQRVSRFILKRIDGSWVSDKEMTQFITTHIGATIERMERKKMRKFIDFTRSIFTRVETKSTSQPQPELAKNLARI